MGKVPCQMSMEKCSGSDGSNAIFTRLCISAVFKSISALSLEKEKKKHDTDNTQPSCSEVDTLHVTDDNRDILH